MVKTEMTTTMMMMFSKMYRKTICLCQPFLATSGIFRFSKLLKNIRHNKNCKFSLLICDFIHNASFSKWTHIIWNSSTLVLSNKGMRSFCEPITSKPIRSFKAWPVERMNDFVRHARFAVSGESWGLRALRCLRCHQWVSWWDAHYQLACSVEHSGLDNKLLRLKSLTEKKERKFIFRSAT